MAPKLIELEVPQEKAFLVAVDTGEEAGWNAEDSLAELANLAVTAGADVVGAEWQNRRHVDPHWYVGKGKAEELIAAKSETGFDLLVADDELSPTQQKTLEELVKVKVIDRSRLILDIFAQHARTHEGRLQVELAQLEYQLPRLTRLWTHLSRTQGGIGSRGPGESQLETDRRVIRDRIKKMKDRVEDVRQARDDGGARTRSPAVCDRRHRRLHELREVDAAQRARRLRGHARRGQALRDPRPDVAPGQARRRADRDPHRHGGLHPQAPAPARRRLPGDARRGESRRRAGRGRRRVRCPRRRAPRHRAAGPRRARRRRQAAARCLQQGRPADVGRRRRERQRWGRGGTGA